MIRASYRIVVDGELDEGLVARFDDVALERANGQTVLSTSLVDQAALNGVLDRLRTVGAELVELHRLGGG